jgi:DNA-binding XRE family transcriptional regulator
MNRVEFGKIRKYLEKTQNELSQILGVSSKAIQSFEQGWRKVPVHVERQLLLIVALKTRGLQRAKSCWTMHQCPPETKKNCPAFEFRATHFCWFINGTICEGHSQGSWSKKIKICRKCDVYNSIMPQL